VKEMDDKYRITVDRDKNRLIVELWDFDLSLVEEFTDQFVAASQQLKAAWDCITDFSTIDFDLDSEKRDLFTGMITLAKQLGMNRIVRVLNDQQISHHREIKKLSMDLAGYEGLRAQTVVEAEAILDLIPDQG